MTLRPTPSAIPDSAQLASLAAAARGDVRDATATRRDALALLAAWCAPATSSAESGTA